MIDVFNFIIDTICESIEDLSLFPEVPKVYKINAIVLSRTTVSLMSFQNL